MSYLQLGLRTLGLLLVAFSTAVLVEPELIGGSAPASARDRLDSGPWPSRTPQP